MAKWSSSLIILILSIDLGKTSAQDGSIQLRFAATENEGKIFLNWTMDLGQTCNGIDITRSTDLINFVSVGEILGICGSPTDTVRYSFLDESPIPNQINYYQLSLGNLGFSQIVSVELIDLEGSGTQIRPNPIVDSGRIFFSNEQRRPHTLEIVAQSGQIKERILSRDEFFEVDASLLNQGIYLFRILDETSTVVSSGKFVAAK